jgi:hypothetical protein
MGAGGEGRGDRHHAAAVCSVNAVIERRSFHWMQNRRLDRPVSCLLSSFTMVAIHADNSYRDFADCTVRAPER